ncbi:MAG: YfcE family phosphodiesterase [Patescibacteria group bacterium]
MQIAVVSDSHGSLDRLSELLKNLAAAEIKNVIHAGDFTADGITEVLQKFSELNFYIARGNCDVNEETLAAVRELPNVKLDEVVETKIAGVKLAAAHRAKDLSAIEASVVISGHTHIPEVRQEEERLSLNPGSLMDDGGYLLLDLDNLRVERKLFNHSLV